MFHVEHWREGWVVAIRMFHVEQLLGFPALVSIVKTGITEAPKVPADRYATPFVLGTAASAAAVVYPGSAGFCFSWAAEAALPWEAANSIA
jgi:hypothetical protein